MEKRPRYAPREDGWPLRLSLSCNDHAVPTLLEPLIDEIKAMGYEVMTYVPSEFEKPTGRMEAEFQVEYMPADADYEKHLTGLIVAWMKQAPTGVREGIRVLYQAEEADNPAVIFDVAGS